MPGRYDPRREDPRPRCQVVPGTGDGRDLLGRVPLRPAGPELRRRVLANRLLPRADGLGLDGRILRRGLALGGLPEEAPDRERRRGRGRRAPRVRVLRPGHGHGLDLRPRDVELVLELGPARDLDRPPPPRLRRVPRPEGRARGPRAARDALGGLRARRRRDGAVPHLRRSPHVPVAAPRHRDQRPRQGRRCPPTSGSSSSLRWWLS